MIVVAWCIARVTAGIITQPTHRHISDWALELSLLAAMIVLRAVTAVSYTHLTLPTKRIV